MTERAGNRFLILETSGRVGTVAVAEEGNLCASRTLSEGRAHARDLAPTVQELLREHGWKPGSISAVFVSRGPGSYTGLRVGIMSAKTFAYAAGCKILGIDTFQAIAQGAPEAIKTVEVIADAQQGKIYQQPFRRSSTGKPWNPESPLLITTMEKWLSERDSSWAVTGPGIRALGERLPSVVARLPEETWDPTPQSVLCIGLDRWLRGSMDDIWTLEPLYLRPSSAEEKWQARQGT
jgi:tRNA threonylcarbamoyladenosine biosynthesis protein TsaB